jgi:DNA processing protein
MELPRPRLVTRADLLAIRTKHLEKTRCEALWVSGSLEGLRLQTAAVVGSRAPSEGARARAHALGRELARRGVCVVSGLALGIDGAAHAGALAGGGPTIGVLGGGHDCFFPQRNGALAEAIVAGGGAVVSPFAPEEPPLPWRFLQRNGIIAALGDVVVVVEAARRSGALNTATWASDLGIDVLAFPGDVDRPKAAGCNALIRDGSVLVRDADDVLAALGLAGDPELELTTNPTSSPVASQDTLERLIVRALRGGPAGFDALCDAADCVASELGAALVRLEIDGTIERRDGSLYALVATARRGRSKEPTSRSIRKLPETTAPDAP